MSGEAREAPVSVITIIVQTKNQFETYILPLGYTGSLTINLNQGGIAGVERLEHIKRKEFK